MFFTPLPNVPIVTVATMWNNPLTGQGYILILHETLYFGKNMDRSLINPNQLRHHGLIVHNNPYKPSFTRRMGFEMDENNKIPFYLQGSTIFFTTQFPTDEELESNPHIIVTCDAPWDPHGLIMPGGLNKDGYPTVDHFVQ